MEFKKFVRKPFVIEAVEVTDENIAEIAEQVGTLRVKDDGTQYIQVDPELIPNVGRVYPGFWLTKLDGNTRCYSRMAFLTQFAESTPEVLEWVRGMNKKVKPQ